MRVEETEAGLQVVLETAGGEPRISEPRTVGNALISEISNAVLDLPGGADLEEFAPAAGIALVRVSSLPGNLVQVSITGSDAVPEAYISSEGRNLVLSLEPGVATADGDDDPIQLAVTGRGDEGYSPSSASTATRTGTPLRDIPQSIQVVPRQVIEDQNITRIGDALRNVSGITPQRGFGGSTFRVTARGFEDARILRNGLFRASDGFGDSLVTAINTVERVEVLKGPASVLYGQVEPGGLVNIITKQPQAEPSYNVQFRAGSFDLIEPSIDFTGALTADDKLTYRLTASYQNDGRFRDFVDSEIFSMSPVLRYEFSDRTNLTFEYEYLVDNQTFDDGLPIDPILFDLPRERFLGEPDNSLDTTSHRFYLTFNHRFNENIRLRSGLGVELSEDEFSAFRPFNFFPETGDYERDAGTTEGFNDSFSWQTDLISDFKTGSIEHQLLVGFELSRVDFGFPGDDGISILRDFENSPFTINVFDPQYGAEIPEERNLTGTQDESRTTFALYLQDQITLLPNLKLLVGGRYDFVRNESESEFVIDGETFQNSSELEDGAFSPRVGIVYQPIEPISIYASFSQSFIPNSVTTVDGDVIEPERGTQYEVGVRGEFGDVVVNLAAYDITKTNIARSDPDNPRFSIPVGEVRSRGIELDVAGEILDGWNVIGSLFFNDAFISEGDDRSPEDDTLLNAPGSGASLWTTYEIQSGDLQGLGFGAGIFYVGDREAQIPNDIVLPSYVRADASIFYRRDNWQAQLNFQNLFDIDFIEGAQNRFLAYPGDPFTVVGSISVRF
ncbi:MAG: TonB-dependent siderophore receptor [Cyanobacteria bacterium P01_F01_bin.153]